MSRPFSTTIIVQEIKWKWSKHRDTRQNHNWSRFDRAGRKWFKEMVTIYVFGGIFEGQTWGWQIDLFATIKASARGEYRAQVSIPQLLAYLPMQLLEILSDRGLPLDKYKGKDIAFARLKLALLGHTYPPFELHDCNEDCHHLDKNCLNDNSDNLVAMDSKQHALLHIYDGDVAHQDYHPDMLNTGFFDYRLFYKNKRQQVQSMIDEAVQRKNAGLETKRYPRNQDMYFNELVRLHKTLVNQLDVPYSYQVGHS